MPTSWRPEWSRPRQEDSPEPSPVWNLANGRQLGPARLGFRILRVQDERVELELLVPGALDGHSEFFKPGDSFGFHVNVQAPPEAKRSLRERLRPYVPLAAMWASGFFAAWVITG